MYFFIHSGNDEHEFLNRDCMVMAEVDQRKTARFPCRERLHDRRETRIPSDGKMYREVLRLSVVAHRLLTALNPALAEVREA